MSLPSPSTPSPSFSAMASLSVDLEQFLRLNVGPFRLTYLQNGALCTIGELKGISNGDISDDSVVHPTTSGFTSTPLKHNVFNRAESVPPSPVVASEYSEDDTSYEADQTVVNLYDTFEKDQKDYNNQSESALEWATAPLKLSTIPQTAQHEDQHTTATNKKQSGQHVVDTVLAKLGIPATGPLREEVTAFRDAIWMLKANVFKALAALLVNTHYPYRRRRFPYRSGRPIVGWPQGVRYKDPAHISLEERLAVTIWAFLELTHHESRTVAAVNRLGARCGDSDLELVLRLALHLRTQMYRGFAPLPYFS